MGPRNQGRIKRNKSAYSTSTTFTPYIPYTIKDNVVILSTLPTIPYFFLPCYFKNNVPPPKFSF
jgi:hypothetical protein